MTDRARTRRRPLLVVMVLLAVGAAVFLLSGRGPDTEQRDLQQAWAADLDRWAQTTLDNLGPGATPGAGGHDLAAVFDPAWVQPVRFTPDRQPGSGAGWDQVDEVNAACTAYTSYAQNVQEAVQPPAAPSSLRTDEPGAQEGADRFIRYQQALDTLQNETADAGGAARSFCGSYAPLVAAHADSAAAWQDLDDVLTCDAGGCRVAVDGAGERGAARQDVAELLTAALVRPNEQIAAALLTQCYLTDLREVCDADAAEARALAQAYAEWITRLDEPGADGQLDAAADVIDGAAADFPEVAAPWGATRQGTGDAAAGMVADVSASLDQGADQLVTALGQASD